MQKRLSIKAIAKDLGISPTTVSFVLNGKALDNRISPELIDRVKEHIEKIGYQPNQMAQSLRTGKSRMIVFMVEDISHPFFASLAKLIEDHFFEAGYTTIYCSTDNGLDKTRRLIRQFNNLSIDGFIISPPSGFHTSEYRKLISYDKAVVFFEAGHPFVQDQEALADELIRTMLKKLMKPEAGMLEGIKHLTH